MIKSGEAGPGAPHAEPGHAAADRAALAFWLLLGGLLLVRLVAIYTESINWDEFALLARASDTARTGELAAGGRPGLATLLLIPVVEGCRSAVDAVQAARWIWTVLTVGAVVGFWFLLRSVLGRGREATLALLLGVALLVLVPVFLRWSVQVRTDQGALAFGLWGGVALLASRRRVRWALAAGVLFGIGFLFTQKLIYVGALAALLTVGVMALDRDFELRRDVFRVSLCLVGGAVVLLIFDAVVSGIWSAPVVVPARGLMGAFGFYRETLGYSVYAGMLPTLLPHLILAVLLVWMVLTGRSRRIERRGELLLALAVLVLGALVMLLHAGAFPYFWMTLGLFPAVAGAVALGPLSEVGTAGVRRAALLGVGGLLGAASVLASVSMLQDSQQVQRQSLAFIERSFPEGEQGFHPESALFCRADPEPFETYFTQTIRSRFEGPDAEQNLEAFLTAFREKPVTFVLDSWRLPQFPEPVRDLITAAYVPYRHAVWVPGRAISAEAPDPRPLEVLVPGTYRWWPSAPDGLAGTLRVGDQFVENGGSLELNRGSYPVNLEEGGPGGILALALETPPDPASIDRFYQGWALREFFGWR